MKFPITLLAILSLFVLNACKKDPQQVVLPKAELVWHMTGMVASDSFEATSLNASVNKYPDGKLELNVNGWNKLSDQTIYLSVQDYKGPGSYKIPGPTMQNAKATTAWYQKDHKNQLDAKSGTIAIQSAAANMITGLFDIVLVNGVRISGEFGVPPHYSDK